MEVGTIIFMGTVPEGLGCLAPWRQGAEASSRSPRAQCVTRCLRPGPVVEMFEEIKAWKMARDFLGVFSMKDVGILADLWDFRNNMLVVDHEL